MDARRGQFFQKRQLTRILGTLRNGAPFPRIRHAACIKHLFRNQETGVVLMPTQVTLTGISEEFSAGDIECLVRTAGEAVCGDLDDLSSVQQALAEQAYALLQAEDTVGPSDLVEGAAAPTPARPCCAHHTRVPTGINGTSRNRPRARCRDPRLQAGQRGRLGRGQ